MVACVTLGSLFLVQDARTQQTFASSSPHIPSAAFDETEVNSRVAALLSQMTVQEKVGQLTQSFLFGGAENSEAFENRVRNGEVGSVLFTTDPQVINHLQQLAVERSRLHIPLLVGFDVIHGFRTVFPVPLAMAASWDPALAEQAQKIAAREASAVGIRWTFAPMVDIARDPRWGRMVEGAGEDPFLGAAMARAQVRGFQGRYLGSPDHLLACVKHFAGYGAADGGRDYDATYIPDNLLRNIYLPPFQAAIKAGVGSVMSAYQDLNDVPATGNAFLLHDILRGELGFRGVVVSDAFAVRDLVTHGFARDPQDAAAIALAAGVDMDMGSNTYSANLPELIKQGRLTVAMIDEAVRAVLAIKVRLGLFEHPYVDESQVQKDLNSPESRQAARLTAVRSAVLLRNEGSELPLPKSSKGGRLISVIGPLADSGRQMLGSWAIAADPQDAVTVLQGVRAKVSEATQVEYAPGVEIERRFPSFLDEIMHVPKPDPWTEAQVNAEFQKAVELAKRSDQVVLVLGEMANMSGEDASRASLDLPGRQEQLMEAVVATGKPTVLLLLSGRPLNLSWAAAHVPAILEAWYPWRAAMRLPICCSETLIRAANCRLPGLAA